jgi:hypothetical protein
MMQTLDPPTERTEHAVPPDQMNWALAFLRAHYADIRPEDPDPELSINQAANLAGVPRGTLEVWKQRSRPDWQERGKLRVPFPSHTNKYDRTPVWRTSVVLAWLIETNRWPRGTAASRASVPRKAQ